MPDVGPGTQAGGGDHRQLGPGVRRGDQQCPPGLPVQRADPAGERALQPPSRREREIEGCGTGALVGVQRRGQLHQGQRIARGGLRDRAGDGRRQVRGPVPQQLCGSGVVDRPDLQLRQVDVLGRVPRVTRR
jgi:hypothetical protein